MKQQPTVTVRLPEELLRQVLYLCEAERRTPNNQILLLLRNSVAYFERSKGKMDRKKLLSYDLSPYLEDREESVNG
ncbi:MAG: hypothetical protein E7663_07270 [Ruminococcaceae bacterium]|nr:hypothetical protein [Oscillospiraceae bacterium]